MRTLPTPAFTLEPQTAAHAPQMFEVLRDPAIYEFENAPPTDLDRLTQRFTRLETRVSPDGSEQWLNWVIRLPSGALAGYVQATVNADRSAFVAYELHSRFWRQGSRSRAVAAVMEELHHTHGATDILAGLKTRNVRSTGLLRKLGFVPASAERAALLRDEPDESVFVHVDARHRPGSVESLNPPSS
jgi:RimJ/RimL family protein N-acetyltransferase